MLRRMFAVLMIVAMLVGVAATACTPAPAPPKPTTEPASTVVSEPTAIPTLEPYTFKWWTEVGSTCCSDTAAHIGVAGIEEAGDLGEYLIADWHAKHPEYEHITIEMILADWSDDGVVLKNYIANDETPHIMEGFVGRISPYLEISVPVEGYYSDKMVDDFLPGMYDSLYGDDGHIRYVSSVGAMYYPVVNASLFEKAGIPVPEPWHQYTWAEFVAMGDVFKSLDDGSYLSCVFTGATSASNWNWELFSGAGVSMVEDGDFSRTTFNTPAAVAVLEDLTFMEKVGYLVPNPPGLAATDCIDYWKRGETAVFPSNVTSGRNYMAASFEAGTIEETWEVIPIAPIAFGDETPLMLGGYANQGGILTDAVPEEYRDAAFSFLQYVSEWEWAHEASPRVPYLKSQVERKDMPNPIEVEGFEYALENGIADCGFGTPAFGMLRQLWIDEVSAAFLGVKTPEQAFADFEVSANAEMSKY